MNHPTALHCISIPTKPMVFLSNLGGLGHFHQVRTEIVLQELYQNQAMLGEGYKVLLRNSVHDLPLLSAFVVLILLQTRQESFTLLTQ